MKKLKLYLEQIENTVVMRVIEQERINEKLSEHIIVDEEPFLYNNKIELRGNSSIYDNDTDCKTFNTVQEAKDYITNVISWLDEVFAKPVEPKRGDWVKVKDYEDDNWNDRQFVIEISGTCYPYICVRSGDEKKFNNNKIFNIISFKEMQPIIKSGYNPETHEYYGEID